MNYTLTITPETYLHCSSGEGGVLVDSDVIFHPNGFPLIPARRIKGLLRESMSEVLEITGVTDVETIIQNWFGKAGDDYSNGIICRVGNGYIAPWSDIKDALAQGQNPGKDAIVAYTTTEVQQTALKDGVAKPRSLRNYRVVNPREGLKFEAPIECSKSLSDYEEKLLNRAVQNLRFIGGRRNRGFGQVACALHKGKAFADKGSLSASDKGFQATLITVSPVIISKQDGDLSTLQTDEVITGAQLRGALARKFMQKNDLEKKDAHTNSDFYTLFLSGQIQYNNLYFQNARPVPAFIHKPKYDKDPQPLNLFENPSGITKPEAGVCSWKVENDLLVINKKTAPQKQSNFHNSRQNRTAGRNTGGELFYYDALQENQTFQGSITGSPEALQVFAKNFGSELQIRIGRSKSAQYGEAILIVSPAKNSDSKFSVKNGYFLLVSESPIILVNDCNFPALDIKYLAKAIKEAIGVEAEIEKVAGATTMVESFNAVWESKSGKFPAYADGTTFKMKLSAAVQLPDEIKIGKLTELGYGKCSLLPYVTKIQVNHTQTKGEKPDDSNHKISNSIPAIIIEIDRLKQEKQTEQLLETIAIEEARKKANRLNNHRLNNHQCGRLENILVVSEAGEQKLIAFLNDVKSKPLGDSLAKANILLSRDKEISLGIPGVKPNQHLEWKHQRHYWLSFFRSLRKFNKQ